MTRNGPLLAVARELAIGAGLGLAILGIGGRAVMRVIALEGGALGAMTAGGTLTVVASGAAAGLAGAVFYALSRMFAGRIPGGSPWVRIILFAVLLALVTYRGLRGSPPGSTGLFWILVSAYGIFLVSILGRRRRAKDLASSNAHTTLTAR